MFDDIYKEYAQTVMKYLVKATNDYHLSEELTQETFLIAYKKLDSFRGDCKVSVWLCQIAKNLLYAHYRKTKVMFKEEELSEDIVFNLVTGQKIEDREQLLYIIKKIHELDEPYREVFLLRYNEEISLKEISELFGKSESWARVTYYRAKEQLKLKLKGETDNDSM